MKKHFLGVDCGGTKTKSVLVNEDGLIVAQHESTSGYYPQVGLEGLQAVLADVISTAQRHGNEIDYGCFGIPAYGENGTTDAIIEEIVHGLLGHRRFTVENDVICGWAGALGTHDGINIVAGTGSIAYGQNGSRRARVGGWGELFSDEGSAYWIGLQGLNAFSKMSDGRSEKTLLYAVFKQRFCLDNDLELYARIANENAGRSGIAGLCILVRDAALQGDHEARRIFEIAAHELASIVDSVRKQLSFDGHQTIPVSYSGGVFRAGELILNPFRAALDQLCSRYSVRPPLYGPEYGAALYAARTAGHCIPQKDVEPPAKLSVL